MSKSSSSTTVDPHLFELNRNFVDFTSFLLYAIFVLLCWLTLFHATVLEIVILYAADCFVLWLVLKIDERLFKKIYPRYSELFPTFDARAWQSKSPGEQADLIRRLLSFPSDYARYIILFSLIKVLPASLIVAFYWHHPNNTPLESWLLFWAVMVGTVSYFWALTLVSLKHHVATLIERLWPLLQLDRIFNEIEESLHRPSNRKERALLSVENTSIVAISLCIATVIGVTMTHLENDGQMLTAIQIQLLTLAGLFIMARVYHKNRVLLIEGIGNIFARLGDLKERQRRFLPLHPSTTLQRFQLNYNHLVKELNSREQELEQWMVYEWHERRTKDIGEIAAMVVHDLSGPIHNLNFCIHEIDDPQWDQNDRAEFKQQMSLNIAQACQLVDTLKSYLKDPTGQEHQCEFAECYAYTLSLLKTHFDASLMASIEFKIAPELMELHLPLSRTNMIHLLYNLMKNSVEAIKQRSPHKGLIEITATETRPSNLISIAISDNGPGLGQEQFELMTREMPPADLLRSRKGLGLRLTRRLVERHHGQLRWTPSERGTTITVDLPQLPTTPQHTHTINAPTFQQEEYR